MSSEITSLFAGQQEHRHNKEPIKWNEHDLNWIYICLLYFVLKVYICLIMKCKSVN